MPTQTPTIPPAPKRPPPKPNRIPPITEQVISAKTYRVDPYKGLGIPKSEPTVAPPKRRPTPSELDIDVARQSEQIKGLDRHVGTLEGRVEHLEEVTTSMDSKLDKIADVLKEEIHSRQLEKASKEEEKAKEDTKTKRYQVILAAIPLIIAPIIGLVTTYISNSDEKPKSDVVRVVVSEYTQEADKCRETSKSARSWEECIRTAQLKNTPAYPGQ